MSDRKCPNCSAVCVAGSDDSYACPACGGSFTFKAGEPKLTGVGELDRLKDKLAKHDADLEELKKVLPASRPAGSESEETRDVTDRDDVEAADDEEDL